MTFFLASYETQIGETQVMSNAIIEAERLEKAERLAWLKCLSGSVYSPGAEHIKTLDGISEIKHLSRQAVDEMKRAALTFVVSEEPFHKADMKAIKKDFKEWADSYPGWLVKEIAQSGDKK